MVDTVPVPHAIPAGVAKLAPAHTLVVSPGAKPQITPYWSLSFKPDHSIDEHEWPGRLIDQLTAHDNRGTQLQTIAWALRQASAPMVAHEAPELVFSFYLRLSIPGVSSMTELRGVDPPVYVIARDPPAPEAFDPVAQGFVKGRRFVLWSKR